MNNLELNCLNTELRRMESQKSNIENQLRNIELGLELPVTKEDLEMELALLNIQMQQMAFIIQVIKIKLDKEGIL